MPRGRRPKVERDAVPPLAAALRTLRERRHASGTADEQREGTFTIVWMARRLGVSKSTYIGWEFGRRRRPNGEEEPCRPDSAQLRCVADVLGLDSAAEEWLFVQWVSAEFREALGRFTGVQHPHDRIEEATREALAGLRRSAGADEAPGTLAVLRADWPEPLILEQLLVATRHHIVNASSYADRVFAEHYLSIVERLAGEEADPVYRPLFAWAAQLRASQQTELGHPLTARNIFERSLALAQALPQTAALEGRRGNLVLAARYGLAAVALNGGAVGPAVEHLRWWLDNQAMLDDPAPRIWGSAVTRTAIDTLLRAGSVREAGAVFEDAAGRYSGTELFGALTPDARIQLLETQARLLCAHGEEAAARRLLLDLLRELAGPGVRLGAAARLETRLIETLLTHTRLPERTWRQWATRALELHRQVGFPRTVRHLRRQHPWQWDAVRQEFDGRAPSLGPEDIGVGPPGHVTPSVAVSVRLTGLAGPVADFVTRRDDFPTLLLALSQRPAADE